MTVGGPAGVRPHRRILASAGCGKTYQLSSRLLELVHRGAPPTSILASTFSRAAAAEIRDRVLRRAARAVLDVHARDELRASMQADELSAAGACALLETLVGALPRLQIRTIDSLFAGVTMAFAAELGLPAEPRVLEAGEESDVLRAAIARCLAELDEEHVLETLASLARGARKGTVVPAIERAVEGLVPLLLDSADGAWDWDLPEGPPDDDLDAALMEIEGLAAGEKRKSVQKAMREDSQRIQRARLEAGDAWVDVLCTGIVCTVDRGNERYGNAKLDPAVYEAYRPLVAAARAGVQRNYAHMTHATRDLLRAVVSRLRAEKLQRGVASFDDLTRALDPALVDLPALDEVWFRLDARVQHVLIDECQDTSAAQWRALRPIAGEIGAQGDGFRSLFAVGDLKQSIYGWRGGEPGILDRLAEVTIPDGFVQFESSPLDESYRSSPEVIEGVNEVFGAIGVNPAVRRESPAAADGWQAWFSQHATARRDAPGFARFVELPSPAGEEDADTVRVRQAAAAACRHAERLHGTSGSVAVLVRRNAMVGRVVAACKRLGVPASGRGGGSLFDAEAVLATVQTLRLAESPDDTVAAFDLATSPLGELVGFTDREAWSRTGERRRVSDALRSQFARRGVAAVVDRWRRALDDRLDAREVVRMRQLVEVVARLEAAAERSPGDLVTLLQAARVDEPGGAGVTVLNVHQSKGLEFDVVIVTDLGKAIGVEASREKVAWRSPARPAEPVPRVSRWVSEKLRWDEVIPLHEDTQARAVQESLCVLYVALTRAKRGLEVHVDPVVTNQNGSESAVSQKSLSAVVRAALPAGEGSAPDEEGRRVLWQRGQEWAVQPAFEIAPAPAGETERIRLQVAAGRGARRARRARAASGQEAERAFLFEASDGAAAERGRALHACFEQLGWLDDRVPGAEGLRAAVAHAAPGRDASWIAERIAEFERALSADAVRAAMTRTSPSDLVRCELRYARVVPAGLEEGSIDRLVLHRDADGQVTAATVIDFKSGRALPETLIERHGHQLRTYRDVVAEQFGLPLRAVTMQIVAFDVPAVVPIP